jgi:hypothetical protein
MPNRRAVTYDARSAFFSQAKRAKIQRKATHNFATFVRRVTFNRLMIDFRSARLLVKSFRY